MKRQYHLRRFGGIRWKTLRVWLFHASQRPSLQQWLEEYETQYYDICKDIPEELRDQFIFRAELRDFVPLQPESSKIIASMILEMINDLKHDVDRLRTQVDDFSTFIQLVKSKELEIADVISSRSQSDSVFTWNKEQIMLFANILALSSQSNLDEATCRKIKTNISKLMGIVAPFDEVFSSVLRLAHDSFTL